jgi:hypothetical protein
LGELSSVLKDANSCGLRRDEEGMIDFVWRGSHRARDVRCVTMILS